MIKLGRFRILFSTHGTLVRWYALSVGYEGKQIRSWKKKIEDKKRDKHRALILHLLLEYAGVILGGMVLGQVIRWVVKLY